MEPSSKHIKILVADDHPVFRQGIHRAFSAIKDMEVVEEAVNGGEMLQKARETKVDLVLLDITMGGEWSLEYMKQLKEEFPGLPVVVVSVYPEEHFAMRYLKAGASGYVTKESPLEVLINAIRKVASGGKFLSPEYMEKLTFNFNGFDKQPHEYLTDREFEVFCLLSGGKSLTEIAQKLCLSVKTVSTHRTHILQKMNMKTNSELTQYALLNRLL